MPRDRKVIPVLLSIAIFILLEIVSLHMMSNRKDLQRLWITKASHGFMALTWGTSQSIAHYFQLGKENRQLAMENLDLQKALQHVKAEERAWLLDSMKAGMKTVAGYTYIPAEIVKISSNSQHNYLIINKGSEDGVRPNSGIMTSCGAIGIIDAVDRHYSYGLSFRNADVTVSARLGMEGAVAPLSWDGRSTNGAILKEVPLQYKFSPGDTVWTSGWSAFFPPDVPLGTVGESKIINGSTNNINVSLFQDFTALRYVTIVSNDGLAEIKELESGGEGLTE
ncbi:MAG: rod shape-determining protein MreC [Bacteroidales bacterium]|nr:rod shape-determining protein MreC [Bacteroidales bacterium]